MKQTKMIVFIFSLLMLSCNNNRNVKSTPIDSTNASGEAPVQYNSDSSHSNSGSGTMELPDENKSGSNKVNIPGGDSAPSNTVPPKQ